MIFINITKNVFSFQPFVKVINYFYEHIVNIINVNTKKTLI